MALIVPLFSGSTAFSTLTTLATHPITEFFVNLFLHPGENSTAVYILAGVTVAACVGLAFLTQKAYTKYCPETKT